MSHTEDNLSPINEGSTMCLDASFGKHVGNFVVVGGFFPALILNESEKPFSPMNRESAFGCPRVYLFVSR